MGARSGKSDMTTLFELKEKAKWSRDPEEMKTAIKELLTHGHNAVPSLQEILNVTAYDEVRMACIEAIRIIGAVKTKGVIGDGGTVISGDTSSATASTTITRTKRKSKVRARKQGRNRTQAG